MVSHLCNYCNKNVEEVDKYEKCEELYEEKNICLLCSVNCDNCGEIACRDEHSITCDMCLVPVCDACFFTCAVCKEECCLDHRRYGDIGINEIEICTNCLKTCSMCRQNVFMDGEDYNTINKKVVCTNCIGGDIDEVERLFKRKKTFHVNNTDTPSKTHDTSCHICLSNKACVAFIPCGHITSCNSCTNKLSKRDSSIKCPDCRDDVEYFLRVYT